MKNLSRLVALSAAAVLAGTALLAPIHRAEAAKGGGASTGAVAQDRRVPLEKLQCMGSSCPGAKVNGVRGVTTGTNKGPCVGWHCPHHQR
jgi:hypothetical protein